MCIPMHLIPNNFPIEEDGLLGGEILRELKANIDYNKNILKLDNSITKRRPSKKTKREASGMKVK